MKKAVKRLYAVGFCAFLLISCDPTKLLGGKSSFSTYSLVPVEGLSSTHIPNEQFFYVNLEAAYYIGAGYDPLDALMYSMDEGPGTDCKIPVDQDSTEDLYCILDVVEGDLWFHNIVLEYNVPGGMCDYLGFDVPWHLNQRVGEGPARVYECTDFAPGCDPEPGQDGEDPTYSVETESRYCLTECVSATCPDGTTTYISGCQGGGIGKTEVEEFCDDLDLSSANAGLANCCMGTYTLISSSSSDSSSGGSSTGSSSGGRETEWGGNLEACLGGTGRLNWPHRNNEGRPITLIENTKEDGFKNTYEMPALIDNYDGYHTTIENPQEPNFITSNYWTDVEDKNSEVTRPAFYSSPTDAQLPAEFLNPYNVTGYPYFTWSCYDKGLEIKHRIHLVVREWNTIEEFNNFKESTGSRGDPDVVGAEGSFCDYYESDENNILKDTACDDAWDVDVWEQQNFGTGRSYNPYPHVIYTGSGASN